MSQLPNRHMSTKNAPYDTAPNIIPSRRDRSSHRSVDEVSDDMAQNLDVVQVLKADTREDNQTKCRTRTIRW
jgi:hypothetical protein